MKKYIIIVSAVVIALFALDYAYFHLGFYIDFGGDEAVDYFMETDEDTIYMRNGDTFEPFEIRGVNLGSSIPGQWSTDYAINEETYLRWFKSIQEMGANTIRIYGIQSEPFYNAFYAYNKDNPEPLYLLHGVWVNDYVLNSRMDAYEDAFCKTLIRDSKIMVDIIHGERKLNMGRVASAGHGSYNKDISPWVIGYILGVDWDAATVAYTDDRYDGIEGYASYSGKYLFTAQQASPFEAMLAMVGDAVIEYETRRYGQQRLIAFSNWTMTDPFEYPEEIAEFFMKCAYVDAEHIRATPEFKAGQFASYHVYAEYPDFLYYTEDWSALGLSGREAYTDESGRLNTYLAYLSLLNEHHSMPVVISEFGVSTGRAMAHPNHDTARRLGNLNEQAQGEALVLCYEDIMSAGSAGCCISSWQDEWVKRTWNTMHAVDLRRTPYWSDAQTNGQFYGLMAFDPGDEESVCYVDGDVSEWSDADRVARSGDMALSMKYDEKFIYFLVEKEGLDFENEALYIPLDITPKSGSNYCENYDLRFDRYADFVIAIDGRENSRVQVQERYEALRSTYAENVYGINTYVQGNIPGKYSAKFVDIDMVLQTASVLVDKDINIRTEVYETGLLHYGNANPESENYDSLADFICRGDCIEIRLPWQLLNFADPSRMYIHDDYYDGNYGVEYIHIDEIHAGICAEGANGRMQLEKFELKGWENKVTFHERLKESYYIIQDIWAGNEGA